jgi:predicted DNA-binding protein (UPF0251 family)/predicted Fe-Mo cluster-binding NifX family protein
MHTLFGGLNMPRCKKRRLCRRLSDEKLFIPIGEPFSEVNQVIIELDEFEAIRLCDYDNKSQIEAGEEMGVSRATLQRLIQSGRKKILDAFLHSKSIVVKNANESIKFKGENNMSINLNEEIRIVFPTNDKETVEEHFGHCKQFAVFTVKDKQIINTEFLDAPPHEPGLLPKFLGEQNASVIITGGMGQKAIELFKDQSVEVILGARGKIEDNLNEYLNGDLYSNGTPCVH